MENQVSRKAARKAWNILRRSGQTLFGVARSGRADTVQEVRHGIIQCGQQEYSVRSLPDDVREILRSSRDRFMQYWR